MKLKIGQILFLEIEPIDEQDKNDLSFYKTRISDIQNDSISIEIPTNENGEYQHLYSGDELFVRFNSEDDVKYAFSSFVIGTKKEVIEEIMLKKPTLHEIIHIDDRNYLRVPAELEIAIQLSSQLRFLAKTIDISGGGLAFVCEEKIKIQNSISCWLLIKDKNEFIQHIPFEGKIIRTKKIDSERTKVMVYYHKIDEEDRRAIIRYCFDRQFELRKK
ncbi:flagellar brake protein [Chengkuizengella sediminis]|uniref:flagellar brake protein n=1 Tax=Chengkuizengella sediminis TaxID=1885917 RepID=UPI001389E366|nr:flagellar brake domain-containing protein [Chengkuizengella sediminis]NDI34330.1 glycosyl transferase [Chengkuizengella sediminis]